MPVFQSLFARLFAASLLAITLAHLLGWAWYSAFIDPRPWEGPDVLGRFLALLVFQVLALVVSAAWAARVLARPITRFSSACARLAEDVSASPMREDGILESRQGARALNRLQQQTKQQLAQQERVVWAVSHDVRTPLARLRLRLEVLEDSSLREALRRDLEEANAQVENALKSLRTP